MKIPYYASANIGETPLISLPYLSQERGYSVHAKMECHNPTGSVKDRSAFNILAKAIASGVVTDKTTIIESSSGNMGIALARLCKILNLRCIIVTDPHLNNQTEKLLAVYNAEIVKVTERDDNHGYLQNRLLKVQELLCSISDSFWTDQYHNLQNPQAHEKTYHEVVRQLSRTPDYIFVAASTCGTLTGIGNAITRFGNRTKLVAVDAVGSILFDDRPQPRFIPGMGSSRKSSFLKMEQIDQVVQITDVDAVRCCRKMIDTTGLLIGGSSGALIAALELLEDEMDDNSTIVLLFPDHGERYLDTIYNDQWVHQLMKEEFKSENNDLAEKAHPVQV